MLQFFRKYHKFFYIVITAVIIVSFSFFGTYSAMGQQVAEDPVALTLASGHKVKRSELQEMVVFLSTDQHDKRNLGGVWGPNFLNDGVIANDFLESGIAERLLTKFSDEVAVDLQDRLRKEKAFHPYVHPQAKFLSAELAWSYFVPDLKEAYDTLRRQDDGADPEAIDARIQLYQEERKFPSHTLRQVLRYQEKQYDWVTADRRLEHEDLSIFKYHTAEDWFGSRFVHLAAQFVVNASYLAEQKGYQVTDDEVMVELMRANDRSFKEQMQNPRLDVSTSSEYFREQLRRLNMTESQVVKVWRRVLLFRRLLNDLGHSVFVDALTYDQFADFANRAVDVEAYELPEALRLKDFNDLQRFEIYNSAVRADSTGTDSLLLPRQLKTAAELKETHPQLVQKRYLLEMKEVDKRVLQSRVGVKETWEWQVSNAGWKKVIQRFPELGVLPGESEEQRFAALETLDSRSRTQADSFAREQILADNTEWIDQALEKATPKTIELALHLEGGKLPLVGVENRQELMDLLEAGQVSRYSGDGQHYYRIQVLDQDTDLSVLTFAEASDVLTELLDADLQAHYEKIRSMRGTEFQRPDLTWKPLAEVRRDVALDRFKDVIAALEAQEGSATGEDIAMSTDLIASKRLKRYVESVRKEAENDIEAYVYTAPEETDAAQLSVRLEAKDQWRLWKNTRTVYRSRAGGWGEVDLYSLNSGDWSDLHVPADGNIAFFLVTGHQDASASGSRSFHMDDGFTLLGREAKKAVADTLLDDFREQGAINLNYLRHR